jgi:hypothetical protein
MNRGTRFFRVVNFTWIDLDPLAFILHFFNQFWIASRLVCSFCEAMAGSPSIFTMQRFGNKRNRDNALIEDLFEAQFSIWSMWRLEGRHAIVLPRTSCLLMESKYSVVVIATGYGLEFQFR